MKEDASKRNPISNMGNKKPHSAKEIYMERAEKFGKLEQARVRTFFV
jgi:hypothetical protein